MRDCDPYSHDLGGLSQRCCHRSTPASRADISSDEVCVVQFGVLSAVVSSRKNAFGGGSVGCWLFVRVSLRLPFGGLLLWVCWPLAGRSGAPHRPGLIKLFVFIVQATT